MSGPPDERFVYGARCLWTGPIQDVSRTDSGLPCCPHCGGVLFELETEAKWWEQVDDYAERSRDESYRPMWEWARGRCFPTMEALRAAYAASLGADSD